MEDRPYPSPLELLGEGETRGFRSGPRRKTGLGGGWQAVSLSPSPFSPPGYCWILLRGRGKGRSLCPLKVSSVGGGGDAGCYDCTRGKDF